MEKTRNALKEMLAWFVVLSATLLAILVALYMVKYLTAEAEAARTADEECADVLIEECESEDGTPELYGLGREDEEGIFTWPSGQRFLLLDALLAFGGAEPAAKEYDGIREGDSFLGTLTYYDVCVDCCGKTDGVTASGLVIENGVEPELPVAGCNWLPLGTVITVDGVRHIVADCGGESLDTVGRLDIFNPAGHEDSLERGIKYGAVIVIEDFPEVTE